MKTILETLTSQLWHVVRHGDFDPMDSVLDEIYTKHLASMPICKALPAIAHRITASMPCIEVTRMLARHEAMKHREDVMAIWEQRIGTPRQAIAGISALTYTYLSITT